MSSRGPLSNHCRGCYKNKVGTILRPSAEFSAPDSKAVTASRAPTSDLPPEQQLVRKSEKRQHQRRCFCASIRYRSFQSLAFVSIANAPIFHRRQPLPEQSLRFRLVRRFNVVRFMAQTKARDPLPGFFKVRTFTEADSPRLPHSPWDRPSSTKTNWHLHSRIETDCQVGLFW